MRRPKIPAVKLRPSLSLPIPFPVTVTLLALAVGRCLTEGKEQPDLTRSGEEKLAWDTSWEEKERSPSGLTNVRAVS
jgi:hypothetical protein